MQSHNNSSADTSRAFAIEIKVVKLSLVQPVSICEMCVVPTSAFSAKASWEDSGIGVFHEYVYLGLQNCYLS